MVPVVGPQPYGDGGLPVKAVTVSLGICPADHLFVVSPMIRNCAYAAPVPSQ